MLSWKGKNRDGFLGNVFFVTILIYPNLSLACFFLCFLVLFFIHFSLDPRKTVFLLHLRLQDYGVMSFLLLLKMGKSCYTCIASPLTKLADNPDLPEQEEKERFLIKRYTNHRENQTLRYPEQRFHYPNFGR